MEGSQDDDQGGGTSSPARKEDNPRFFFRRGRPEDGLPPLSPPVDLAPLLGALEVERDLEMLQRGRKREWIQGPQAPIHVIRTLCSTLIDVLEEGKVPWLLNKSHKTTLLKACTLLNDLFIVFSPLPDFREEFKALDTLGLVAFSEKMVAYLLEDVEENRNALTSLQRGALVKSFANALKAPPIRHSLLDKLLTGMSGLLQSIVTVNAQKKETEVFDFHSVNALFRLLQVLDFLLITTNECVPWIQEKAWNKLVRLNEKVAQDVGLGQLLVHFQREVELARPLALKTGEVKGNQNPRQEEEKEKSESPLDGVNLKA